MPAKLIESLDKVRRKLASNPVIGGASDGRVRRVPSLRLLGINRGLKPLVRREGREVEHLSRGNERQHDIRATADDRHGRPCPDKEQVPVVGEGGFEVATYSFSHRGSNTGSAGPSSTVWERLRLGLDPFDTRMQPGNLLIEPWFRLGLTGRH